MKKATVAGECTFCFLKQSNVPSPTELKNLQNVTLDRGKTTNEPDDPVVLYIHNHSFR